MTQKKSSQLWHPRSFYSVTVKLPQKMTHSLEVGEIRKGDFVTVKLNLNMPNLSKCVKLNYLSLSKFGSFRMTDFWKVSKTRHSDSAIMTHSFLTLFNLILTTYARIIQSELIWSDVNLEQNRVYNDFLSFLSR